MVTYIAFLRAINLAGQKLIRMETLRQVFESLGFRNVRTYIQSGNVIFDSARADPTVLSRKIENKLRTASGHDVTVIILKLSELEALVRQNPFKKIKTGADAVPFVVFLSSAPATKPKLPLISKPENLEVVAIQDRSALVVLRRKQNGRFGYPNQFVEKELGVSGTTRNWNTINKILEFAAGIDNKRAERKKR